MESEKVWRRAAETIKNRSLLHKDELNKLGVCKTNKMLGGDKRQSFPKVLERIKIQS